MTPDKRKPAAKTEAICQNDLDRLRIRDAMARLIDGAPLYSDGKLTVKSLAEEVQVKRWLLTHKHIDLQDEFRAKVAQTNHVPAVVQQYIEARQQLEQRVAHQAAELRQERETVKRLERVVLALTLENQRLQVEASATANVVRIKP
ncbi:hypothetical protein [Acidithrix sp. C25]|uniref:hypothetical protein n=1 Tax=Acidithrix sp. C25 TaxID=1671482 RepID=UPI00191BAA0B|nr:hypothetical protein [Acidithrix sp. C25]CAG4931775.1 unnamed protein product [Acidithrix sp. C25]